MKAENKHRQIAVEERKKLADLIPLTSPLVVFIDPSNKCNFKCSFCPTGDIQAIESSGREQTHMSIELYQKIIDDLVAMDNTIDILRLYKDGEPLLNPHIVDMVAYAKKSGIFKQIEITTNGSLLNSELNLKLIHAGLSRLHISIEGVNPEHYKRFSKYNIDYEDFVANIKHIYENKKDMHIYIKANGDYLNEAEKLKFFDDFGNCCDSIFLEHFTECWPNFNMKNINANAVVTNFGEKLPEKMHVCPYVFYAPAIHSNGLVSLCCNDWEGKLVIGDLKNENFKNIWNSQAHREYQMMHLNKDRYKHPVCGPCRRPEYYATDHLDKDIESIKEQLKGLYE